MSLDVRLYETEQIICDCGKIHEIKRKRIFESNTTGNLYKMAIELGIYFHLWKPETIGISKANELIEPLKKALSELKTNEKHYEKFNSPNGFGKIDDLVFFIDEYLTACTKFPDAIVEAIN